MADALSTQALNIINTALGKIGFGRTLKETDQSFQDMLNQLNSALQRIVVECPYLFVRDFQFHTQPSIQKGASETVIYADSGYILQRAYGATGNTPWFTDGSMSEMDVFIQGLRTDGTEYYEVREVQDVWIAGEEPNRTELISLNMPVADGTFTITDYVIVRRRYHLPIRFSQIDNAEVIGERLSYPIDFIPRATAQRMMSWPWRAQNWLSDPKSLWFDEDRNVRAPLTAPIITFHASNNFIGTAEPGGTFDVCYTHCFGYADEIERLPGSLRRPLLESAPSPITSNITANSTSKAVEFSFPDVGKVFGFHIGTRKDHSGYFIRVYLRRTALATDGSAGYRAEVDDTFYPLLDVDEATAGILTQWDGQTVGLDKRTPLAFQGSQQTVGLFPTTTERLTVNIQGKIDPPQITNANQQLPIPTSARALAEEAFLLEYCRGKEDFADKLAVAQGEFSRIKARLAALISTPTTQVQRRFPMRRNGRVIPTRTAER